MFDPRISHFYGWREIQQFNGTCEPLHKSRPQREQIRKTGIFCGVNAALAGPILFCVLAWQALTQGTVQNVPLALTYSGIVFGGITIIGICLIVVNLLKKDRCPVCDQVITPKKDEACSKSR